MPFITDHISAIGEGIGRYHRSTGRTVEKIYCNERQMRFIAESTGHTLPNDLPRPAGYLFGLPVYINENVPNGQYEFYGKPVRKHNMRMFVLQRDIDETGVSGTGVVAEGIEFSDGTVMLRWIVGDHKSSVVWDDIESVEAIHGHDGKTQIQWVM